MTQAADNIQMVDCTRYHTRMTKAGCDRYRADHPEKCKGCSGSGEVVAELPRTVVPLENKRGRKRTGKPGRQKVAACAKCQRVMPLPGRGLCGKCYSIVLKNEVKGNGRTAKENPVVNQPAAHDDAGNGKTVATESVKAPEKQAPCSTMPSDKPSGIDWLFSGEEELLEKVKELARKDRRDVRCEVLCIIEDYLEGAK